MSVKCVSSHKVHRMCVAVLEHSVAVSHADVSQASVPFPAMSFIMLDAEPQA